MYLLTSSNRRPGNYSIGQFVIFNPLSYCFEEIIGYDLKASLASRPVSRLIRWCKKPGDITKEFWENAIQFHMSFHGLKITNCGERYLTYRGANFTVKRAIHIKFQIFAFVSFQIITINYHFDTCSNTVKFR